MSGTTSHDLVASLVHTINSHTSDVNGVCFSKDRKLATCSADKTVRVWDMTSYNELPFSPLCGHTYYVHCCCFSPFGTLLASCSTDGKVIIWDAKTGQKKCVLQHESKSPIRVCKFSPNSAQLISGSDDNNVCLWDVSSGALVITYKGHEGTVIALDFTPNGEYIVSGSNDGDLQVWDARYGHAKALLLLLDCHDLGVMCCDFSPIYGSAGNGVMHGITTYQLATCGMDDLLKLWEFVATTDTKVSLKQTLVFHGHEGSVLCCKYSINGRLLASASNDKTVRLWDPIQGVALHVIEGHTRYVITVAFCYRYVITVALCYRYVTTVAFCYRYVLTVAFCYRYVIPVAFCYRYVITVAYCYRYVVTMAFYYRYVITVAFCYRYVITVAYCYRYVVTMAFYYRYVITVAFCYRYVITVAYCYRYVVTMAFYYRYVITVAFCYRYVITVAYCYRYVVTMAFYYRYVITVAFCYRYVITVAYCYRYVVTMAFYYRYVITVAFCYRYVITVAYCYRYVVTMAFYYRYVITVAFSSDGQYLASGSNDRTVMIWKLQSEQQIFTALENGEPVCSDAPSQSHTVVMDPHKMSVEDVCQWLEEIGLEQYVASFRKHDIDGLELMALTQDSLATGLGIESMGHRSKLIRSRSTLLQHPIIQQKSILDSGVPDEYLCPITREIMKDPVICSDGYSYERAAIASWMNKGKNCSPMTNAVLTSKDLTPNRSLKMLIQRYLNP
ncbi:WD repeat, SAM and U-box domain-containing protein 1-like isoform X4 [Dreissena polymorpha]|uniref:WD repeat, SAM and U-box domain-containing protein 1-like isoform X4 n=1 Tax=Dreissena polymorpha TaxID=45954 RepID=UPI002265205E|nr:WD repeat, SAM and U-box domain-containing protein 1-like isoform X4 [Dreissena polymorpha]